MKGLVNDLRKLPWIVRLLLVLFADIYGNIYRLLRSIAKNNILGIVLALILLFTGGLVILWIIDIVFVILDKDLWWID